MNDQFGFTSSPLLRDRASLPTGDGTNQGMMARLAEMGGFEVTATSSDKPPLGPAASPTLNFPIPPGLAPEPRVQPHALYGYSQPYNPNVHVSGDGGLALPPLRCTVPESSFAASNPASSVSASTVTTSSSYFGINQPPPHTYPSQSSSSASSDQLYTPTSAGYTYLTPPATGPDGQTTSLPSITLPGVTSLFPPHVPAGQIQLPLPTTVEPKTFSQWSNTGPIMRGSTSSLSLRDSRFSVSPLSAAPLSISRSTSVESECARPEIGQHPPLTTMVPKMDPYGPATMMVYGSRVGPYGGNLVREGEICFTDEAEVKQSPNVKRRCHNCDHRSPPSWRKSLLVPGKILCNKCGIFERTHNRPRPPQADDLKLRRHVSPPTDLTCDISVSASTSTSTFSSPTSQYSHSRGPVTTPVSPTFQLPPVRTTFWTESRGAGLSSPPPGYGYTNSHTRDRAQSPPTTTSVGYSPYPRPGSLRRGR